MAKMQHVYKDKQSKKWFYKKRLPKGNPTGKEWAIKKGFDTAGDAKQALDKYLQELERLEVHSYGGTQLKAFTEQIVYPHWKRNFKRSSYTGKVQHCKHIFDYFGEKTFAEITQRDIAGFRSYLLGLKNSQKKSFGSMYINLTLCSLGQIYDLACEHEIVKENIARKIKGLPQKPKTEVNYWTLPEFQQFLSVIDTSDYLGYLKKLGFYMLFFTGLRVGELMARKWTDIDWENQAIYIDSTLYYRNVDDWSACTKAGPKTASSKGWVKLTPKIMEMLKTWKAMQERIGKMEYIVMYNGVMYAPKTWSLWKAALLQKWNAQAEEGKRLKNIRVHDLRDSHGMWLLMQGVDIKTIQKRLRHAKATTTMNYYLDKLPENEDKVLQAF